MTIQAPLIDANTLYQLLYVDLQTKENIANVYSTSVYSIDLLLAKYQFDPPYDNVTPMFVYVHSNSSFSLANLAISVANAAFIEANTANLEALGAFAAANASSNLAQVAFDQANSSNVLVQAAFDEANSANSLAQAAFDEANVANLEALGAFTTANSSFDKANSSNVLAQAAFDEANVANLEALGAFTTANAAFNKANAAFSNSGVITFNSRSGNVNLTSSDVVNALGSVLDFNASTNSTYSGILSQNDIGVTGKFRTYGSSVGNSAFGYSINNFTILVSEGSNSNGLMVGTTANSAVVFGANNIEVIKLVPSIGRVQVGIGTSVPEQRLHVSDTSSSAQLILERIHATDNGKFALGSSAAGFSIFETNTYTRVLNIDSAGLVSLPKGQLNFPSTQNPSSGANVLDDYEEGTWTPADASGAGLTLTVIAAKYIKIGTLVFFTCHIVYPSTASGLQASISGLPFSGSGVTQTASVFSSGTGGYQMVAQIASSGFQLYKSSLATVTNANLSTAFVIITGVHVTVN